MKTIILSLFLSVMSLVGFAQAYQVTVSGTVADDNGSVVEGIAVTIETEGDSVNGGGYYNVVFTDMNGFYTDSFDAEDSETGVVFTSITDCDGSLLQENNEYSASVNTFQVDFIYCSNPGGGGSDTCMAMYMYYNDSNFLEIHFEDLSMGNPTSWDWDFGDGAVSTEQNPVHLYAQEGEYEVTLSISGDDCSSSFTSTVIVSDDDSTGFEQCQAMFWANSAENDFMTIVFEDQSWAASGNAPDSWAWEFGDGATSAEQNPTHTYAAEGDYEVCLTITDTLSDCESTYCMIISVFDMDTTTDCNGYFTYAENDTTGLSFTFTAVASSNESFEYTWDFGDGVTGTGEVVDHTYAEGGAYLVKLDATGSDTANCSWSYVGVVWAGGTNWTINFGGNVFVDSTEPADAGTVYLMTFDTTGNGLVSIDTTTIDANGHYEFEMTPLQYYIYFVQAELSDQSIYFGQYLPTYYISALSWEEAMPTLPAFLPNESYDIFMVPQNSYNNGNGEVEGLVTSQGNRGVVQGVMMLLMDADGKAINYVRTNENGTYDFSELAYGTYKLRAEYVGVQSHVATFTLDENTPSVNINVVLKNGEAFLGVDELQSAYLKDFGDVYPNPVTAEAFVNITMKQASSIKVSVVNQIGQQVVSRVEVLHAGNNRVSLNTSSLPQGVYIVKVLSKDGAQATRKLVKVN